MTDHWAAEKREFVADERQRLADVREAVADAREAAQEGHLSVVDRSRLDAARRDREQEAEARRRVDDARNRADLPRPLAAELIEVSRALARPGPPEESFEHVVDIAQRITKRCDAASYTEKVGDRYSTLASTSSVAREMDDAQYRSEEGPCIDAAGLGAPVRSADLGIDQRWPTFTAALAGRVARSVMSTPVTDQELDQIVFGSLNQYGGGGLAFDDEDLESAMLLSAHLAVLLSMRAARDAETVQLRDALAARDLIGQAKGLLMARQGIGAEEAFDILRRASQRLNRKLRVIASEMVEGSLGAGDES